MIEGNITIVPNEKNHRDLDIALTFKHEGAVNGLRQGVHRYRLR